MPSTNTALKTLETLKWLRLCSDSHHFQGSGEERDQEESSLPASSPAGVDTPLPSPNKRQQYYHAQGQSDAEDAELTLCLCSISYFWMGSVMRSRSKKSLWRKSWTSPRVSGPPMFNIKMPVFGFLHKKKQFIGHTFICSGADITSAEESDSLCPRNR